MVHAVEMKSFDGITRYKVILFSGIHAISNVQKVDIFQDNDNK